MRSKHGLVPALMGLTLEEFERRKNVHLEIHQLSSKAAHSSAEAQLLRAVGMSVGKEGSYLMGIWPPEGSQDGT